MVVHKSYLRRRAEGGPGSRVADENGSRGGHQLLGSLLGVLGIGRGDRLPGELDDVPLPDLLSPGTDSGPDVETLLNLLELAFLGRASAGEIDRDLDAMTAGTTEWDADNFADDLFLADFVKNCFVIRFENTNYSAHRAFLERVLATPPTDLETISFRQAILRELEGNADLRRAIDQLLAKVLRFLTLLRASRDDARLEPTRFRFDVLRAFRSVIDFMAAEFELSGSGLQRLSSVGQQIKSSKAYEKMAALLDHHDGMASIELAAVVGADGRLRHLEILGVREQKTNPFFRRPLRRWWDRLRIIFRRYSLQGGELAERMVMGVFQEVAPAMARVVQLVCHLELYAATRSFATQTRDRGLDVCLPELSGGAVLEVDGLFNPLLLSLTPRPVPTDLCMAGPAPIMLITGPNSGGKTRLLQAVGILQVLAQSGLYAPCARARLPLVKGLFASIVEFDRADQAEGRLGTEMMRLRTLFETVPDGSLILLDELCSGTNPSEAIEIVDVVLRLLRQIDPIAFVTSHFLDFADTMQRSPTVADLGFLQVEVDTDRGATYRFVPGVATTSLAVGTARRLGVAFDELERDLEKRNNSG
ncbi:MAG: DNA mismatch repair protein [Acidobacteriota bacterium]|nr:DNA mismatch repair protein [Acidobacteriota bacterium]